MAITVNLKAPNGLVGEQFVANGLGASGTTYTVPSNGIVTGVSPVDAQFMVGFGFQILPQAGSGSGTLNSAGNLYTNAYGATALQPTATGADYVLAVYSIPANTFDGLGNAQRSITIQAQGNLGATTNNKRCKIYFNPSAAAVGSTPVGGTVIADLTTSSSSGVGWELGATVTKVGAPNSNTQVAAANTLINGSTHLGVSLAVFPTATENAAILVAVTGNAATATSDITLNLFSVTQLN